MLRATPAMFSSALPGVIVMVAAVLVMFFVPWLDRSPVKSIRYKGTLSKINLGLFSRQLHHAQLPGPAAAD